MLTAERIEGKWHRYDETASARSVYNYYRDYDPDTGRYLQPDPIGLAGGINPYVYAYDNPLRFFDVYGLAALPFDDVADIVRRNNRSGQSDELILCIIWKESSSDPLARSKPDKRGLRARGLMQMRQIATRDINGNYGDLFDAERNVRYGTAYIDRINRRFDGNLPEALDRQYGTGFGYSANLFECERCLRSDPCSRQECLERIHP